MDTRGHLTAGEARLRELLIRGQAGDAGAYRIFLADLAGHLRAYFRKRLSSLPDEVEDLVQGTLLAVHLQRHTYDTARPLTAWVHAIAKYKLVDLHRHRAHAAAQVDSLDDMADLFAASEAEAAEARRDLDKLLAQLPDRQRLPIVLVKVQGLSVVETARATGLSESAVKVGIHRGLKALAAMLRSKR
jgi:RNA polymerase sigma-70 factor (ECF subfamily)